MTSCGRPRRGLQKSVPMNVNSISQSKILILTLKHGAGHDRVSKALARAITATDPKVRVEVADVLEHCKPWFRRYYNSYEIPLRYLPALWSWIEAVQSRSKATSPGWIYRRGAHPLFSFIREFDPDVVVATEVGVLELTCIAKRETGASFRIAAVEMMDFYPAWVQPEVDLYLVTHPDLGTQLEDAGAPGAKILCTGQPLDPAFARPPSRDAAREKLGLDADIPILLTLFGGAGFGKPRRILAEFKKIRAPVEMVFIAGRNERLKRKLRELTAGIARARVLGWVDNIQEWIAAADLMVSKPGGTTLTEGFACGLPMLAFDPLPGNEERTCVWIEKWQAGRWIKRAQDLAPTIERLLANRQELEELRGRVRALARPRAAYDAAKAILGLVSVRKP
jgi:processive 1,2-diacylglycerol beta-glucosyltransferase